MRFWKTLRVPAVVAVLLTAAVLEFGAVEARAQVLVAPGYETVYVPAGTRVKVKRGGRVVVARPSYAVPGYIASPAVVAPTAYYAAPSTVVTETRYIQSVPVVAAPVVERSYVPTVVTRPYPAVVETQYLQPVQVIERPVITYPY